MHQAEKQQPESTDFIQESKPFRRLIRLRRIALAVMGGCVILCTTLVLCAVLMDVDRFSESVVAYARLLFHVVAAVTLILGTGFVIAQRLDPLRLARLIENQTGSSNALLISAAELSTRESEKVGLSRRVMSNAARFLRQQQGFAHHLRRGAFTYTGLATFTLMLTALGLYFAPAGIQHGVSLLLPVSDNPGVMPYRLSVEPGDQHLPAGGDLAVTVNTEGFSPDRIHLHHKTFADAEWQEVAIPRQRRTNDYEHVLLAIDQPIEYFVSADGVESERYRVTLEQQPRVSRIDQQLHFPAQSGRAPEWQYDRGDIRTVDGTHVKLAIQAEHAQNPGQLRLEDDRIIQLKRENDAWTAEISVLQDDSYVVEYALSNGVMTPASRSYRIEALPNTLPRVSLLAPAGDIEVTRVEEIEFSLEAQDDLAVKDLELVLWINGEDNEVLGLADMHQGHAEISVDQILYLEDRDVEPGDSIGYFARVRDSDNGQLREVTSDIFFMKVRPFDQRYRQGRGGGGGGGAGGAMDGMLTAQQRQLVVALFKLNRDDKSLEHNDRLSRGDKLEQAQAGLRDRVEAILSRIGERDLFALDETLERMLDALLKAVTEMQKVEAYLSAIAFSDALRHARSALFHLQKAEAGIDDIVVAMNNQGGAGSASDLTSLLQLEIDQFRSRYEEVQRGQWQSTEKGIDEALQKLRELAHREQLRRERNPSHNNVNDDSASELLENVEELIRQLERLTLKKPDNRLQDALDAARNASQTLREAEDANARSEAMQQLRAAEQILRNRTGPVTEGIDRAMAQAAELQRRQQQIMRNLSDLEQGDNDVRKLEDVIEDKRSLGEQGQSLDQVLAGLGQQADDRETSAALDESRSRLDIGNLQDRLEKSRRALENNPASASTAGEMAIQQKLSETLSSLESARLMAANAEAGRQRSENQLRELVREQDRLQQALQQAQAGAGQQANGASETGTGSATNQGNANGFSDFTRIDWRGLSGVFSQAAQQLDQLLPRLSPTRDDSRDIASIADTLRKLSDLDEPATLIREHGALVDALKDLASESVAGESATDSLTVRRNPLVRNQRDRRRIDEYFIGLSDTQQTDSSEKQP